MRIKFSPKFDKQLQNSPHDVQRVVSIRLDLFVSNPYHPLLRNHKLVGEYMGRRSINITGDWRAIYREVDSLIDGPFAYFVALGTHNQLYR